MQETQGVYFLANDAKIELTLTFLNSFRQSNPNVALCWIPFDDSSPKIAALKDRYRFSVYDDAAVLAFCDSIQERLHAKTDVRRTCFRKCAIWAGPFEKFIYIDIDTVVLKSVEFVFELLPDYGFVASHSSPGRVWEDSVLSSGALTKEQITFSANSGFIASHRGALTIQEIEERISEGKRLRNHMFQEATDQPFLNFCMVKSGKAYTTLHWLHYRAGKRKVPLELWAGKKGGKVVQGNISFPGRTAPILLVHWSGVHKPRRWQMKWRHFLLRWRLRRDTRHPINFFMPYRALWNYYRRLTPA